jgi:hypothetical protein
MEYLLHLALATICTLYSALHNIVFYTFLDSCLRYYTTTLKLLDLLL